VRRALVPALLAALVAAATTSTAQEQPDPRPLTTVTVGDCEVGAVVPTDFLGLSIEWSMVEHWFGRSGDAIVPATVNLLRSLRSGDLTQGVLRIGGVSQDGYRFVPDGSTADNKLFFGTITTGMVDALLEVARQSGWKVVLGLNLRNDDPAMATALTAYAASVAAPGTLLAVAPGNEAEAYLPDTDAYLERYGRYVDALDADLDARLVPLTGPDSAHGKDLARVEALRRAHGSRLAYLGWHNYGNRPSLKRLLQPEVSAQFRQRVALAAAGAGLTPVRMSEGNSVGHGGLSKVSDVTGSTAWTVDTILTGAADGLAGYHVHSWDAHYYNDPKWRARYTPLFVRDGVAYATPGFYALALLREVSGRRFCETAVEAPAGGTVKAWALAGLADRSAVAYLVNKGTAGADSARVVVRLPERMAGRVTVSRIVDVRGCGGRSASINSAVLQPDGTLAWTPQELTRDETGAVEVALSPCQTALVHVARSDDDPALPPPLG
jgi:hypothetical protein